MDQNTPEEKNQKKTSGNGPVDIIGIFIKFDIAIFIASLLEKGIYFYSLYLLYFSGVQDI